MSKQNRSAAAAPTPLDGKSRQNEFFVHRDGIDRDVITADICTYLGNDALVKPGMWIDEKTGLQHHGYYVTAYRNLTTAMIDDLKADSARWDQERRKHHNTRYEGSSAQYHNRSQAGYSGAGAARQNYESSAYAQAGYSQGGTAVKQSYPGTYGNTSIYAAGSPGPYAPPGYASGSAGYAVPSMDPRTYPSGAMGVPQMPQMATGGYPAGTSLSMSRPMVEPSADYAVRPGYDTPMPDAGAGPGGYGSAPSYPNQQTQGGYPYQPGVGQPQAYLQPGQMTQPVDIYYGRRPGGSGYPVATSAPSGYPEGAIAPAAGMPFVAPGSDQYEATPVTRSSAASPDAQAQVPSSGPSERRERTSEYRERRDRDREGHAEKRRHQR